jgi:Skp family chaperone for outer membrane proteins
MWIPLLLALQVTAPAPPPPARPMAMVNMPRLVAETAIGKAASVRIDALRKEKEKAIADKRAAIQVLTQKNAADPAIERSQRELERLAQDAEAELGALNAQLQGEFTRAVSPILKQILEEDHLGVIIEYPSEFVIFVDPSADITEKVIQRLAAAEKPKNDR